MIRDRRIDSVRLPFVGASLALLLQIAPSCDASDPSPPGSTTPPATTPPDTSIPTNLVQVQGLIGPEGGTLTHPAGAHITIPPGALAAATVITLTGIAAPAEAALGGAPLGRGSRRGRRGRRS